MSTLRQILLLAARNERATLRSERQLSDLLEHIHALFVSTNPLLTNSPDTFLIFFLGRAHGAFVGAVRMAASGQLPETFMLLRGVIENALYALHIKRDPASPARARTWIRRDQGDAEQKQVRSEFKLANVMKTLHAEDVQIHAVTRELYVRCLDLGAHPNQPGHFASASFEDDPSGMTDFEVHLFTPDATVVKFLLRSCAEVGVLAIRIFAEVFAERLRLTAFPSEIDALLEHLRYFERNEMRASG